MRRLIRSFSVLLNIIADFVYAPFIRSHIHEIATKFPLLPGQIWLLPRLGKVLVCEVNDKMVSYRLLDAPDDDDIYAASRKDFVLNCRGIEEFEEDQPPRGTIIPLIFPEKN